MYTPGEIRRMMQRMVICYDTREQATPALRRRLDALGMPSQRMKLDFGDYTAETRDDEGNVVSLARVAAVERKMSLDEACLCFGKDRARFRREYERAANAGARLWLLIEDATWEAAYAGKYRSMLTPAALTASLIGWAARFGITPLFCRPETTPKLISEILRKEMKLLLEREGEITNGDAAGDQGVVS